MIQDFISQVKGRGLARINRYAVMIQFPNPVASDTTKVATLFCDAVNLPGASISTTPSRIFGEVREMPYEKIYDPVTMSFYVDSGLEIKQAFEQWMEMIFNTKTRTLGYYKDYTRPVHIYVYTVDDDAPYMLTLHEAYPKAINSVQLDTNGREIMKMTLTMQYKYWTSTGTEMAPTPSIGFGGSFQDPQGFFTGQGFEFFEGSWPEDSYDPPSSTITTVET